MKEKLQALVNKIRQPGVVVPALVCASVLVALFVVAELLKVAT